MANQLGASMAMANSGMLGDLGKQLLDPATRGARLQQLSQLSGSAFSDLMKTQGVSPSLTSQFLDAQGSNQQMVSQFGLHHFVRGQQAQEIQGLMAEKFADAIVPGLRSPGDNPNVRRANSRQMGAMLSEQVRQLSANDPGLFTDPSRAAERDAQLAKNSNIPLAAVQAGMNNLEQTIRGDAELKKFGGLGGLLTLNNQKVVNQEEKRLAKVQSDADTAEHIRKGEVAGPPLKEGSTAAAANNGQGGSLKLTGSLTLNADGTVGIDAEGGVPLN